ncbi:MAG: DUF192 domain-containing protein [Pseudomonadota bacterium]
MRTSKTDTIFGAMLAALCLTSFAHPLSAQDRVAADNAPPPGCEVGRPQALDRSPLRIVTETGAHEFQVENARTGDQQRIGYMFRPEIPKDEGMLFAYGDPQKLAMWMRNTYASLDILFIQRGGRIANIAADAIPCSLDAIVSRGRVVAVLELAAGEAVRRGIRPGDIVYHEALGNWAAPTAEHDDTQ